MKNFLLIIFCIIILTACATQQKYSLKLDQEIGKTKQQLLATYGKPQRTIIHPDGSETFIYIYKATQVLPLNNFAYNNGFMDEDEMFYPFTYGGNEIPDGNFLAENITDFCKTSFEIKNNIITSYAFNGNACVSM